MINIFFEDRIVYMFEDEYLEDFKARCSKNRIIYKENIKGDIYLLPPLKCRMLSIKSLKKSEILETFKIKLRNYLNDRGALVIVDDENLSNCKTIQALNPQLILCINEKYKNGSKNKIKFYPSGNNSQESFSIVRKILKQFVKKSISVNYSIASIWEKTLSFRYWTYLFFAPVPTLIIEINNIEILSEISEELIELIGISFIEQYGINYSDEERKNIFSLLEETRNNIESAREKLLIIEEEIKGSEDLISEESYEETEELIGLNKETAENQLINTENLSFKTNEIVNETEQAIEISDIEEFQESGELEEPEKIKEKELGFNETQSIIQKQTQKVSWTENVDTEVKQKLILEKNDLKKEKSTERTKSLKYNPFAPPTDGPVHQFSRNGIHNQANIHNILNAAHFRRLEVNENSNSSIGYHGAMIHKSTFRKMGEEVVKFDPMQELYKSSNNTNQPSFSTKIDEDILSTVDNKLTKKENIINEKSDLNFEIALNNLKNLSDVEQG